MIRTLADQYLAQNAGRRYPFRDDTELPGWLPDAAVLDFRCTVRGVQAGTAPEARLTGAERDQDGSAKLTVTLAAGGEELDTLRFQVPDDIATKEPYTTYAAGERACGTLTVTAAVLPPAAEEGEDASYDVDVPFAATTVVCDSLKVDSIQSAQDPADALDKDDPDGLNATASVSGEIELAEGRNSEPYLDGNRLRIDIFKGGGLGERCQGVDGDGDEDEDAGQTCGTVLFTINGERPGSDGELRIVGEDGITVTPYPEDHAVEIRMDDAAAAEMAVGCAPACQEG